MAGATQNSKRIIAILSTLSVALLIVIIALSILLSANDSSNDSVTAAPTPAPEVTPKVCTKRACINAANGIVNNMDTSFDPCENFNMFSCGNFIKTQRIPSDQTSTDSFSNLRVTLAFAVADQLEVPINDKDITATGNAKKYYLSCLDEETVESEGEVAMRNIINTQLGGWPIIDENHDPDQQSTFDKLVAFRKIGLRPIFDFYTGANPKDPSQTIIRLQQPDWFFNRQYYNDTKVIKAYKKLIYDVASNLAPTKKVDMSEIDNMFELEKKFALNLLTQDEKRNQTYKNYTLEKLNQDLPDFDWVKFVRDGIFSDYPDVNLKEDETILVLDWPYLEKAMKLMKEAEQDEKTNLDNLMVWSYLKDRTGFLPKKYKDAKLEFDKVYTGFTSTPARARTCANAIIDIMPYAVGRLYVSKYFDERSKEAATEMIENIRKEFKQILNEIDWMDNESKVKAQEKADYIDPKIGYPEFTYNDTHLNEMYKNYNFNEKTYLQNNVQVARADARRVFSELRKKRDLKNWISGPAIVNAFYSSTLNQICFPAGILQQPFYDYNYPNYLNYGAIGSVIGHEITHGFDDQGRKYDKDGIFFPDGTVGLWSDSTIQNYKQKAQCIIDQYTGYKSDQVNLNLNGFQTQGENIADNGGVKESFRAYQKWAAKNGPEPLLPGLNYTQEQLFFINYAQVWCLKATDASMKNRILTGVHSPGPFRILGPTSNIPDFGKVWNCKAGTNNNPVKKCAVW